MNIGNTFFFFSFFFDFSQLMSVINKLTNCTNNKAI